MPITAPPRNTAVTTDNAASAIDFALTALEAAQRVLNQVREGLRLAAAPVTEASSSAALAQERQALTDRYRQLRNDLEGTFDSLPAEAALLLKQDPEDLTISLVGATYRIGPFDLTQSTSLPGPKSGLLSEQETGAILRAIDEAFEKVDRAAARYRQDTKFLEMRRRETHASMLSVFEGRRILR